MKNQTTIDTFFTTNDPMLSAAWTDLQSALIEHVEGMRHEAEKSRDYAKTQRAKMRYTGQLEAYERVLALLRQEMRFTQHGRSEEKP